MPQDQDRLISVMIKGIINTTGNYIGSPQQYVAIDISLEEAKRLRFFFTQCIEDEEKRTQNK